MLGLQNHAARHPCPFCMAKKEDGNWTGCELLRTCDNISDNHNKWVLAGSIPNELKEKFFNCKNLPIIPCKEGNKDVPIYMLMAPPSLHLKLAFNDLLKQLGDKWEELSDWFKKHHISVEAYHGGCFEGNEVSKILSLLEDLQQDVPYEFQDFVNCMLAFRNVVRYVLQSSAVETNYKEHIRHFGMTLDILKTTFKVSETPKFHVLREHVAQFIDVVQRPLTLFSEQELESSHYRFWDIWDERYKIKNTNDPKYASLLKKAVIDMLYENL